MAIGFPQTVGGGFESEFYWIWPWPSQTIKSKEASNSLIIICEEVFDYMHFTEGRSFAIYLVYSHSRDKNY
jgi:hypothetical protein